MMTDWQSLADRALTDGGIDRTRAELVLQSSDDELLAVLDAAFRVRQHYFGKRVQIHVLENAKRGNCSEDCSFCSQSVRYGNPSGTEPMSSVDTLVAGARRAYGAKARRYCMVTATRGPSSRDIDIVCEAAKQIKSEMPIELCASLGLLDEDKAERLAEAGIDRFNHNIETSERHFENVVTTHAWKDRVKTIQIAKAAGLTTCCGGIIGMGEDDTDVVDMALALRELEVDSMPINFLDPRPGTPLADSTRVDPRQALRALAMFRLVHPPADLRVAGGREVILRALQPLALYPANSIFTQGYLTTPGAEIPDDHQMIRDMGFSLEMVGSEGMPIEVEPNPVAVHLPVQRSA